MAYKSDKQAYKGKEKRAARNGIDNLSDIDIGYIKNRVNETINMYHVLYPDRDIYVMKQLQFNSVLIYIRDTVFIVNGKSILDYRDIELLLAITDLYISVCFEYIKSVSIYGYSLFTGINYNTLMKWNKNINSHVYIDTVNNIVIDSSNEVYAYKLKYPDCNVIEVPNTQYSMICQKIRVTREHALADKAEDGSVMSLALGKIEFGWQEGKLAQMQANILENYRKPSEILTNYEQKLIDNITEE